MEDSVKSLIQEGDIIKTNEDGKLIFNPFNIENREITLNEVQSILRKYGIKANIFNIKLYQRAFVHRSYTKRPALENLEANIEIG